MRKNIIILILLCPILPILAQEFAPDSTTIFTIELDSVTITGRAPQIRTVGSKTNIQVNNTVLAKMGNVINMLSHTPGLHFSNNGIEVNGLGAPVYVINGKIINDPSVLLSMQAQNIKKIEIDRMPSVQYSPEGQPVIKITTIKKLNDYLFMNVGNYMKQTRKFSDVGFFNMTGQINKFSAELSYMGGKEGTMNKETYFREIYRDDHNFTSNQQRTIPLNEIAHRLNLSAEYNISPHQRIGLLYFYQFINGKEQIVGNDHSEWLDNNLNKRINRNVRNTGNIHSASIQYNYYKEKFQLDFSQEIATHSNKNKHNTHEEYPMSQSDIMGYNNNDYSILTTTANFSFPMFWNINALAGIKYNYVKSNSSTYSDTPIFTNEQYLNEMNVQESSPQAYLSLAKQIGKVVIYPAVRYHYIYREISNSTMGKNNITKTKQKHSSFCPVIQIQYHPNNDWALSMNYRKTIVQPQFSQINSGLIYVDSLLYNNSNPNIKAETTERFSSSVSWRNLTLSLRYTYKKSPIIIIQEQIEKSSNITTSYATNLPKAEDFSIAVDYSKTFSKLQLSCGIESVFPKGEYFFRNKIYNSNQIAINGQININYAITPHFYIFTDFTYQGHNEYLTSIQKTVSNWSLGITGSFFKDKMELYLALNDILGNANYNNITYKYGNIIRGTSGKNDFRGIELRISYNIFNKPISIKSKRQNEDIIQRTLK